MICPCPARPRNSQKFFRRNLCAYAKFPKNFRKNHMCLCYVQKTYRTALKTPLIQLRNHDIMGLLRRGRNEYMPMQHLAIQSSPTTLTPPNSAGSQGVASTPTGPSTSPPALVTSRARLFEQLAGTILLNELGLPRFLYRSDLVPPDYAQLPKELQRQHQNCAALEISYSEGYPTFLDGLPIWQQMDHELEEDFVLFELYRDLILSHGYRQLSMLPSALKEHWAPLTGSNNPDVRAFAGAIVEEAAFHPKDLLKRLHETACVNFWFLRAKAYDMFILTAHRKKREQRLMRMETYHYDKAQEILEALQTALGDAEGPMSIEKLKNMDPLDFVKAMKEAAAIQRAALLGEHPGAKKGEDAIPAGASIELIMRNVARTTQVDKTGAQSHGSGSIMEYVDSPEGAAAAQELILRMQMGNRKNNISKGENGDASTASDEAADLAMVQEAPLET